AISLSVRRGAGAERSRADAQGRRSGTRIAPDRSGCRTRGDIRACATRDYLRCDRTQTDSRSRSGGIALRVRRFSAPRQALFGPLFIEYLFSAEARYTLVQKGLDTFGAIRAVKSLFLNHRFKRDRLGEA